MALLHSVSEHNYHDVVEDTRTDSSIVSVVCLVSEHKLFSRFSREYVYTMTFTYSFKHNTNDIICMICFRPASFIYKFVAKVNVMRTFSELTRKCYVTIL